MRLGFTLPQIGPNSGPEALITVAKGAEELGFDSLWVLDRLLWPVDPQAPYPVGDGTLPELYKIVLDPLETLTFVGAHTSRIGLGTSVLNIPFYNPVMLARRLSTIDVLSGGRLRLGLGMGWSPDEFDAAGSAMKDRGKRADEFLQVLKAIWTTDPVEFKGEYYSISKSFIGPKPVQKPHPPIFMAAFVPAALRRVSRYSDGWMPVAIPLGGVAQMFEGIKEMARESGRDPETLDLVVRGNLEISETPINGERAEFTGTLEQIKEDVSKARQTGASELILDAQFSPGVDSVEQVVARMEQVWELAQES